MTFSGWPETALDFYEGLEADNTKTYWTAHRATYDQDVLAPMQSLVTELGGGKIFRPYRDVRFSKDKTPYKDHIAATAADGYIQVSAAGLMCGSGYWVLVPDQIARFRAAVDNDLTGGALETIIAALARRKVEVMSHDSLKRVPSGFAPDHPRAELLTWKAWSRSSGSRWSRGCRRRRPRRRSPGSSARRRRCASGWTSRWVRLSPCARPRRSPGALRAKGHGSPGGDERLAQ